MDPIDILRWEKIHSTHYMSSYAWRSRIGQTNWWRYESEQCLPPGSTEGGQVIGEPTGWGTRNVLHLDLGGGHLDLNICKNLLSYALKLSVIEALY